MSHLISISFTDKLAKKRDKEVREAFKAERDDAKKVKKEEKVVLKQVMKLERSWEPELSRRGRHEARVAARHEAREHAAPCDHGIVNCKLCHPHKHK